MSRLRVLICRVDEDDDEQMTEVARVDLPAVPAHWGDAPLDKLEAQVVTAGQRLLGRLCELQWEEVDAQAVARYCADAPAGSVWGDGSAMLTAASRFGTLQLRRQICVLTDMDAEIAALDSRCGKTRALKQGMMQELLTGRNA